MRAINAIATIQKHDNHTYAMKDTLRDSAAKAIS